MFLRSFIFFLFGTCVLTQQINYNGYKVYQVLPANEQQISLLKNFANDSNVDFWTNLNTFGSSVKIMVRPKFQQRFESTLNQNSIHFKRVIENVDTVIKEEQRAQYKSRVSKGYISFDKYYRYSEIQDYLHRLATQYPQLTLLENYGLSYENRSLTSLKISNGKNNQNKPVIFVDAGIHAREWIGPPVPLYIIDQVLEGSDSKRFLQNVDWVVIPLLNPDGYEYTHTTDRFWRKTRSNGQKCDGVDPNRNFDFHWLGPGASNDECSIHYAGPKAFSEPETTALSKMIKKYANRTKLYLSFHSAAQSFLYPWGYTSEYPENAKELQGLAEEAEKAVSAVNGTRYKVGSSFNALRNKS